MENSILNLPTPLQILIDPISLAVVAIYALVIIMEAMFPARELPKVKYWKVRGLISFTVFFYIASYLPLLTDPFLSKFQLIDLSHFGMFAGALIGVLLYQFGLYAYHITMHKFDFLWRTFHQMHHSAERLDSYGALFHSPMDMIGFTLVSSVCFTLLIGVSPQSITIALLVLNFLSFFQHANINTPHWLGYLIQRPESHSVHHGRGIHQYNYADIPLIDMIFGTFKNPHTYQNSTGFYNGASSRILDMLQFKDVSSPRKK